MRCVWGWAQANRAPDNRTAHPCHRNAIACYRGSSLCDQHLTEQMKREADHFLLRFGSEYWTR